MWREGGARSFATHTSILNVVKIQALKALLFQTPEHLEIRGNFIGQKEFHRTIQIKNWRHTIQSEKI